MPSIERQLREEFSQQMRQVKLPGSSVSVGRLMGCVYVLLDFDLLPLYVGKSTGGSERLGSRISRHVLGQRSDASGRCFPPYEVLGMLVYPMRRPAEREGALSEDEQRRVTNGETRVYEELVANGSMPLNEERPCARGRKPNLPSPLLVPFTQDPDLWDALWDADLRAERWVDVIKVMASRVRAGGGTPDQRRVLKAQVERLDRIVG